MSHPDPLDPVHQAFVLHASGAPESPTPECLDDDTIAALAEGTLDAAARAALLPHLAACPRCRGAVASVARALADAAVAREVVVVEGGARRRFFRIALPAAAAAALLLLAWPPGAHDGGPPPPHRAPPINDVGVPVPQSPVGAVAGVDILQWTAVAGADRYRVTVFDAGGRVLYETQLADTAAALPDSIVLVPGRSYLWEVEARTGWDRWSASELVEFSIAGGGP